MTPNQASELIPIMQAFAEGKVVQIWVAVHDPRGKVPGVWVDIKDPSFDILQNWRVKPEPPATQPGKSWDLEPAWKLAMGSVNRPDPVAAIEDLANALVSVIENLQRQPNIVQPDK